MRSGSPRRKTRQPRLSQRPQRPHAPARRPIALEQSEQVHAFPQRRTGHDKKARETMSPAGEIGLEAQQHTDQQGGAGLPPNGVGAAPQEVAQLQGLLELLEERLDAPATAIEVADRPRTLLKVVGDENHPAPLASDLDPRLDPAQEQALALAAELNPLVLEDVLLAPGEGLADAPGEVVLGPGRPARAPLLSSLKPQEVRVGFLEDRDFPGRQARAEFPGPPVLVLPSRVDDREGGREAAQVQPQAHFGGGLPAAALGPVHAVGRQFQDRGVDRVDRHLEASQQAPTAAAGGEAGLDVL